MAVPEQEKEKPQMSNSKVLHFLFVLEACFQQKSYNDVFRKLGICPCKLYIIWLSARMFFKKKHQLESESISFLLGQRNGFEPDQLFILTAFLHAFVCTTSTKK
jgi:hypothetical protein